VNRRREIVVLLALALYASPVIWEVVTSITPASQLLTSALVWPTRPTLASYRAVLTASPLPRALLNSLGIAVITTVIATALGTLGAYALARLRVPGRSVLLLGIVLSTALPAIATVGPLYLVLRAVGLRDTWGGVIVAHTSFALPLMLWLVAGFLRALPRELEEAAFVDGADRIRALRYVVLPAAAPGVASAARVGLRL